MKSFLLGAVVSIALTGAASAQTVLNVKDAGGATVPIGAHNGGTPNLWTNQSICDPLVYNQCATVDSSGRLTFTLAGSPTVTVSGVATAANQVAVLGSVSPGSAPLSSQLGGCVYNASAPSPSSTQMLAVQCDNKGNMNVDIAQVTGITEGTATAGQTGALVMGTVLTSAQAYTGGTSHILGMNTDGNLRADQMVVQGSAGAPAMAHICGQHVTVNPVTATDTLLVAAVAAKSVYVCDYAISTGAADNLFLESFTTGTCAGTVAQMDTKWFMPINGAKTDANPYWRGLVTAAGSGVCLNTSTTGPASFTLYFDQY